MSVSSIPEHLFPQAEPYFLKRGWFLGGYDKDTVDVHKSPTRRLSDPSCGLGKAASKHGAVVLMNKSRTRKTSELWQLKKHHRPTSSTR